MTENKRLELWINDGRVFATEKEAITNFGEVYKTIWPIHVIEYSEVEKLEKENSLLKRSEICGYCDFDNSLRKERDALESENAELKTKLEDINKNSISLFLHEQRMAQVDEQLKDFQQVVDKYADGYIFDEPDDDTDQDLQKPWRHTSGKLARAMQSKWGK